MILIPELSTIVLMAPRTASGSIRRAIAAAYPRSILLYRHMEADGVPSGYDRWQKVGLVRNPIERLWSLYNFLQVFGGDHPPAYLEAQRASVRMPFSDWIVSNQVVFTNPYDTAGSLAFAPLYTVRHSIPETRKSQFLTLRPDLGTDIFPFAHLQAFQRELGITIEHHNKTSGGPPTELSSEAMNHVERFFAWDMRVAPSQAAAA